MGNRATREAFGETLVELAREGLDVVAVDADLAGSTKTAVLGAYDPDRLVDVGIAEQDMIGVAAGLSLTGRIAFTGSFAVFGTGRCYDQIRNIVCDANLNVKVCPTHAGVTVGEDGATHQMLEDIALMRTLPPMRVLVPADFAETVSCLRYAARTEGPVYVRMGRYPVPAVYDEPPTMELPYARVLEEGHDLSLMACGVEVSQALEAARILEGEGISCDVVDVCSVKPLDEETLRASAERCGAVVTCEEHSVYGGLGGAVAELLSQVHPVPMGYVGMRTFGTSAPGGELLHHFGLDAEGICKVAREVMARKG